MDAIHQQDFSGGPAQRTVVRPLRSMDVSGHYWFAMFAASAFGTNIGDLWAVVLLTSWLGSLASMLSLCAVAIWYDRRMGGSTEVGYWVAIVLMRAAATNLADFATHDVALGYVPLSAWLWILTWSAARFTTPDRLRSGSPRIDGWYWAAMFIAGIFGTVAGDMVHHSIGLYAASAGLCIVLVGLILVRSAGAPTSMLLYWSIVMTERCAGTAVGDALASRRAISLGIPLASACTGALLLLSLFVRARLIEDSADETDLQARSAPWPAP